MTNAEKTECIASMPAGTMVYFPGHAMMYTGMEGGVPYTISNTGILSDSESDLRVRDVYTVILNPLTVRRANGSTWLTNLKTAVILPRASHEKVYIPEHYLLDDVKKSDYFYDSVEWAFENGITKGSDANHFEPRLQITAGEMNLFLERATNAETATVTDLKKLLTRGEVLGQISAYADKDLAVDPTYLPEDPCTRAMAITFLYRAFGLK